MAQSSTGLKLPLQSKKFLAFLLVVAGWKLMAFWILSIYSAELGHYGFLLLVTLIIVEGFFAVGYVLGQAALDKYAHMSEAAFNNLNSDNRVAVLEAELKRAQEHIRRQAKQ